MEPASLIPLPPGTDIRFYNPTESDAYGPFVKNYLRAVAAGMDLPYELVSGDLEGVTYSSIRTGLISSGGGSSSCSTTWWSTCSVARPGNGSCGWRC